MHDLVAPAEVGVLVREGVEAVGTAGDDLRHPRLVERRDVRLGERLEDVLVARATCRISRARLARPEDRDVEPRGEQELRRRDRRGARALVERSGAADPVEDLGRGIARLEDAHAEPVRPRRTLGLRLPPRVRPALDVAQHRLGLGGEARLDHDEISAEVDDVVDVLDRDRALLNAGAARHAVPDDVVRDRVRDERGELTSRERRLPFREELVANSHDQELRGERLAGRVRRADVLAAAALGARHRVEHLLPREVGDRPCPEAHGCLVLGLEVEGLEAPGRTRAAEEDVDPGGRDVQVLRVREIGEEARG